MWSDPRTSRRPAFRLPLRLRWMLLGWVVAEALVFLALVRLIGFGGTVLLGLATTVLGLVQIRRVGLGAVRGLRASLEGGTPHDGLLLDGLMAALGALLLIVPGFLANAAGLALAAPSARRALALRFGAGAARMRPRSAPPGIIDLGPEDWRPVDRP